MLDERVVREFRESGLTVLRDAFDPGPLSDEMNRALAEGLDASAPVNVGSGGVEFRTVLMMCERTPVSLALLDRLAVVARGVLGRDVVPVRAKGTRYEGSTGWHRDSDLDVPSLGCAAYLEPVTAQTGALRVIRGSHLASDVAPIAVDLGAAIETEPGDVIVFDEHLTHGSTGGRDRRQWRVDFVADPIGAEERARVCEYFSRIFDPGWDGGYDVDRYPSYGPHWRQMDNPWVERLGELGVYALADAQESAMRARRAM